jgi:hypothetical protein
MSIFRIQVQLLIICRRSSCMPSIDFHILSPSLYVLVIVLLLLLITVVIEFN